MTSEKNKTAVVAFFEAMNNADVGAIIDAYHDDGYVWTMGETLISGKYSKKQIEAAAGGIFAAFPKGIHFRILGMVAEGDQVAVEATSSGEHASGRMYDNHYHFLFTFRDGKLLELKEFMDTEKVTEVLCEGQRPQ